MNRVYIAALFEARGRLLPHAQELARYGYKVVSSWLNEDGGTGDITESKERYVAIALRDVADLSTADFLILDTIDENVRGGREVEWGLALTRPMLRYIVGPQRNIFHLLATRVFADWDEALRFFERLAKEADKKRDDRRDGGGNHR